jgi:trigger factor
MQVSVTAVNGLERRLEVTLPGEQVSREVDQRLKQLARTVRLHGFRQGKVPLAVVRRQYGSQVHMEAVSDLMERSFSEAVSQQNLRPAAGPRLEPLQVEPGSELRYAAVFEVLPQITVKPLESISIERPIATVSTEDVDQMIESMRRQKPIFTPVERPAGNGDRVWINYEGRIDGELFPGGKGDDLKVILGAGSVLKELDEALHGMQVGESKTVDAHFPADYGAKSVAGKAAVFQVSVTKIESQTLPEVDAAFAESFGVTEGGVEELRNGVKLSMEREVSEAAHARVRNQLLDALYQANPLELPRVLIDEQIRELQVQMLRRAGVQQLDQLPPKEPYEEPARRRVALGLLMGEIVRSQALRVERSRVAARLEALVATHPDPEAAKRQYLQSREAMEQIESAALEDQAIEWLLTQVKVTDKPATFRKLTGFGENS